MDKNVTSGYQCSNILINARITLVWAGCVQFEHSDHDGFDCIPVVCRLCNVHTTFEKSGAIKLENREYGKEIVPYPIKVTNMILLLQSWEHFIIENSPQ